MFIYYAMRLILSSVDSCPDGITPLEQYDLACQICRSLEWYILNGPESMINRLAVELHVITTPGDILSRSASPVGVAWEVFPEDGPERLFIRQVFELVRKRLWGSAMPDHGPRSAVARTTGDTVQEGIYDWRHHGRGVTMVDYRVECSVYGAMRYLC